MATEGSTRPYGLANPFKRSMPRALAAAGIALVERALAVDHLNDVYSAGAAAVHHGHFTDGALRYLNSRYEIDASDLARIPADGPVIAVANHPFGGVDGLLLNALLRRVRVDVKLFGSVMLARMQAYRPDFFFVDNFGAPDAAARNIGPTKAALRWLRQGKCIGVFPAGEVSHLTLSQRTITDPPWNSTIARLARASGASIVPLYFDGRNSMLFQLAGLVHPRLRTILLPREVKRCRNRVIRVCVGSPLSPARISKFASAEELSSYIRLRTYILGARFRRDNPPATNQMMRRHESIITPETPEKLKQEIDSLPSHHTLAELQEYSVHYAAAGEILLLLREIGRLREITFRQVGEGTGRAIDLDRFDDDYLHLFVWHRQQKQLIGAYRMGLTEEILARRGIDGLYTSTLFKYRRELLEQIGPAIELGRSFVRPEYQRDYAPLMLLWRGIGRFIAAHPTYRKLLGPVSISNEYQSLSKVLLMRFLMDNNAAGDLQKLVEPRNPPRLGHFRQIQSDLAAAAVRNIEDVDELVSEVESDRAAMPILLRQYIKLNAKLLAFNVDPEFGDVLDGLMLADLTEVDRPMLWRYMGKESAEAFLRYWDS